MQFYVPSIGDQIRLLENWRFRLFAEYRNSAFTASIFGYGVDGVAQNEKKTDFLTDLKEAGFKLNKLKNKPIVQASQGSEQFRDIWGANGDFLIVTLPKGLVLTVDRIYIRKGKEDFDSITFNVPKKTSNVDGLNGRFWAKLSDINRVQFEKFVPGKNTWIKSIEDEDDFNFLEI
jgi:hypothetical protein